MILLPVECGDRGHLMCVHALAGPTAASLSEMSLFTVCLIAYASPNDTNPDGTHWRLLWLDINFTQMCPQWACVHVWMNAHSHTYTAAKKPQYEPLLGISLSLWLYCHHCSGGSRFRNEMSLSLVICKAITTCVHGSVSVHYVHNHLHKIHAHTHKCANPQVTCLDVTALSRGLYG